MKKKLNHAEINNNFPYDPQEMKSLLENLDRTFCFPQRTIERDFVNDFFYSKIGGLSKILSFKCVRYVGHIRYSPAVLDNGDTWSHMYTRNVCGLPDPWTFEVPKGFLQPDWTCRTINGWGNKKCCTRCSSLKGEIVIGKHDCVITEVRTKRGTRTLPPEIHGVSEDEKNGSSASETDEISDVSMSSAVSSETDIEEEQGASEWYLEKVFDHGVENGKTMFRCRWSGFDKNFDTWQLEEAIPPDFLKAYKSSVCYLCWSCLLFRQFSRKMTIAYGRRFVDKR